MPSIDEVCTALADVVATVDVLRAKGFPDDQVNPPEAHVLTQPFDPRLVFDSTKSAYQLGVRVIVPRTNLRTAYEQLRKFMDADGSTSIRAAIEDEDNWAQTIDYAVVTQISQPFELELAGVVYMAVGFDVEVVW